MSSTQETKNCHLFRYTDQHENSARDRVVIELAYANPERPHSAHKVIGTVRQKNGQWNVHHDCFHGYSWRSAHRTKLEAMRELATLEGVHKSPMIEAQLSGAKIYR